MMYGIFATVWGGGEYGRIGEKRKEKKKRREPTMIMTLRVYCKGCYMGMLPTDPPKKKGEEKWWEISARQILSQETR